MLIDIIRNISSWPLNLGELDSGFHSSACSGFTAGSNCSAGDGLSFVAVTFNDWSTEIDSVLNELNYSS